MTFTVTLDLPDKKLHPNGGKAHHVGIVNKIAQVAHEYAWAMTLNALNRRVWSGPARLDYVFYLINGKTADDDNCIAWMKKYRDGMAEAMKINDKHMTNGTVRIETDRKRPRVEITVTGGAA